MWWHGRANLYADERRWLGYALLHDEDFDRDWSCLARHILDTGHGLVETSGQSEGLPVHEPRGLVLDLIYPDEKVGDLTVRFSGHPVCEGSE